MHRPEQPVRPAQRLAKFGVRAGSLVGAFLLGAVVATAAAATAASPARREAGLGVLSQVYSSIQNLYYEDADASKLAYAGARGMVATLDPHSAFLEPAQWQALSRAGRYFGLGLEVARAESAVVVASAIEGTPAARAGVRAGDVVLAIDGQDVRQLGIAEASARLQGAPGTRVMLKLGRPGTAVPLDVAMVRETIEIVPIDWRLVDGKVGYVRMRAFERGLEARLKEGIDEMRAQAGPPFRGVVLDLRDNPGGSVEEGVAVADRFLARGRIATAEGRGGLHRQTWNASGKGTEPNYPLVVLVNGGSASASEIVAGALQDQGRAIVFGTPSFGKASIQDWVPLEDGSMLAITRARYFTPLGQAIHGRGIIPDVLALEPGAKAPSLRGVDRRPVDASRVLDGAALREEIADVPLRVAVEAILQWPKFTRALAAERSK